MTLWFIVQEYFLNFKPCLGLTEKGPFSPNRPIKLEAPGPPCNHKTTGAVSEFAWAGKYQKKMLELKVLSTVK